LICMLICAALHISTCKSTISFLSLRWLNVYTSIHKISCIHVGGWFFSLGIAKYIYKWISNRCVASDSLFIGYSNTYTYIKIIERAAARRPSCRAWNCSIYWGEFPEQLYTRKTPQYISRQKLPNHPSSHLDLP